MPAARVRPSWRRGRVLVGLGRGHRRRQGDLGPQRRPLHPGRGHADQQRADPRGRDLHAKRRPGQHAAGHGELRDDQHHHRSGGRDGDLAGVGHGDDHRARLVPRAHLERSGRARDVRGVHQPRSRRGLLVHRFLLHSRRHGDERQRHFPGHPEDHPRRRLGDLQLRLHAGRGGGRDGERVHHPCGLRGWDRRGGRELR